MVRREVVNNADEYDRPGEWDPSPIDATGASPRGTRLAASRSSGKLSSPPPDSRDWSSSRPQVESMPQIPPDQLRGSASGPDQPVFSQLSNAQAANQSACLYLGPAGERCYRPALDNGFCPTHQPNASPTALRDRSRSRKKKAAATVGIIAAMWPLIEELLRQLFRLLR